MSIPKFQNCSNPISISSSPTRSNENQFVPIDKVDSLDWVISRSDTTALVCNNPGVWNIILQYQLFGRKPVESAFNSTLIGWFNINNEDVQFSAATQDTHVIGSSNVLVIAYSSAFKKGDEVRAGIRSVSFDGDLNVEIKGNLTLAGVFAPSLIITATKTSD